MRVAIADDSALFRDGLALLLDGAGVDVIHQARDGSEILELVARDLPDVVVLDIRMPPTFTDEGLVAARALRRAHPGLGVLVLSTYAETAYAAHLVELGERAMGYLLKDRVSDLATLLDALDRVVQGETVVDPDIVQRLLRRQRVTRSLDRLTPREREVLGLMAEGRSNAGIARTLHLQPKTIEHHIAALFAHLGLPDTSDHNRRVLAVLTWLRSGA